MCDEASTSAHIPLSVYELHTIKLYLITMYYTLTKELENRKMELVNLMTELILKGKERSRVCFKRFNRP